MVWWLIGTVVFAAVTIELQTSTLESWFLARSAAKLSYVLGPGPSPSIVFPRTGPADKARGYTQLPVIQKRLEERGFEVKEQVRFSPQLARLARAGISPPYRDGVAAGLQVIASDGGSLVGRERPLFGRFEDIPNLVTTAASYIEDRQLLLADENSRQNPVVNWGRLAAAGMTYAGRKVGLPMRLQGGSTLATQMEKYLHSPGGRTEGGMEKLKQMAGASLRAYREGADTRHRRQEILLDYLDSIPLGAAPGYGEVSGFMEGMNAWFGITKEQLRRDLHPSSSHDVRARAFKHAMALLCAVRAPSFYLREDRQALMDRIDLFTKLMCEEGFLDPTIAARVPRIPLQFRPDTIEMDPSRDKAAGIARVRLMELVGTAKLYDLDRMHAIARTTLDSDLQKHTDGILNCMGDSDFLHEKQLYGEHLLTQGADPRKITYTVLLFERTPMGDVLRVSTDSSGQPFDMNAGMKMELGSTAKLRTLTHYLEIIDDLYKEIAPMSASQRRRQADAARDPLTKFVAGTLVAHPDATAEEVLELALDRQYSAAPWEVFFTAGGNHVFSNFEGLDDYKVLPVREAVVRSTNLVFIRLMRDVVRYHTARLPYDADAVLADESNPVRVQMMKEIADKEARSTAKRLGRSEPIDMAWLFKSHNKAARDSRLRTRIERDAFERMVPSWRRLGFPFQHLVPSLATAIGSSADRPAALAELMGIIANGGILTQPIWLTELRVGPGTPYETVFRPSAKEPERVLAAPVADTLRNALLGVVERGTARRAAGALTESDGTPMAIGGKTGSGDNRYKKVGRGGSAISSSAYSRTAAFAFFAGDRYYGVLTASVFGKDAERFHFTSALPVSILALLAPKLNERLVPTVQALPLGNQLVTNRPHRAPGPVVPPAPERHASAWFNPLRKTSAALTPATLQ